MSRPPPLPVSSLASALGELARAQQRAGRSAMLGLALLGLVALASPLLAYHEDLRNAREEVLGHLSNQAHVQADALGVHLGLLEAELRRLAEHPQLSPEDGPSILEKAVLDRALHHSPLFSEGVALLTLKGERVWSDPPQMTLGDSSLNTRPWFRRVLSSGVSDISLLEGNEGPLVVAVPIVRGGQVRGLLVGELRAGARPLPGVQSGGADMVLLLDGNGQLLLPAPLPRFVWTRERAALVRALVMDPGPLILGGSRMLGAAAPVPAPAGISGMVLAVLENEERDIARLRRRFLGQFLFHVALLGSTLLIFTFLLRRSYHSLIAAEDRLRHQETMAALGSASQLIAHEVKNALNGIQAALSLLRPAASAGEVALPALRAQVQRLGHLARSLLSFGAPRPALRRTCELRLLVEEALQSVRLLPEAEDVPVSVVLAEGVTVQADPALLVSAVDNLLRNAVEAGAVARDTGLRPSPWVRVALTREAGEAVLMVEDNAGGVDPDLEPRLWEPFATARAKGVGLGLPMARAAVEAHGGSLTYTRLPDGSRFTLRLPLESTA
ncbi:HAMP domain-containing histidine kinase [Archangium violaceum]|uniref:sensor histidine kinase n=1 Tax=Archangium violaceum TaxID=83451 RepID=UPI00194E2667|nr:sensor histidine kinase [Archangium violaceum]QRN99397.1 HAMP domain-containing histidine kinase [Archangium violaceum]